MRTTLVIVLLAAIVATLGRFLEPSPPNDTHQQGALDERLGRSDVPWQAPEVDPDNLRGF